MSGVFVMMAGFAVMSSMFVIVNRPDAISNVVVIMVSLWRYHGVFIVVTGWDAMFVITDWVECHVTCIKMRWVKCQANSVRQDGWTGSSVGVCRRNSSVCHNSWLVSHGRYLKHVM